MLLKRPQSAPVFGILLAGALIALAVFATPGPTQAQTAFSIEDIGTSIGLGSADLKEVVINIIKWVLGILALVGVVMLIYAGILWMTSAGNADRIERAKKIIIGAVIGLVIVLLSWAIVTYVVKTFLNTTEPDTLSCDGLRPGDPCGSCLLCSADLTCTSPNPACDGLGDTNRFRVTEIETTHTGPFNHENVYRCSKVQPNFNTYPQKATFDDAVAAGTLKVEKAGGEPAPGTWSRAGKVMTYKPDAYYDAFTQYVAFLPKSLKNTANRTLSECIADGSCPLVGDSYEWRFTTNNELDSTVPVVTSAYPVTRDETGYPDQAVPRDPLLTVTFSEAIDLTTVADADSHPIPGRFTINQLDGRDGAVVGTVDPAAIEVSSGSGNRVEFRLLGGTLLESYTWYRITVQDVEDMCGNKLQPPEIWEFETDDTVAGIRSYDPTGDRVCPDSKITVVFTLSMWNNQTTFKIDNPATPSVDYQATLEAPSTLDPAGGYTVDGTGGSLKVLYADPGRPQSSFKVYQFSPTDPLATASTFDVTITTDRVIDASGTTLTGSWTFKTATAETCACKPAVYQISPETGSPGQCVTLQGACFTGTTAHAAVPDDPDFDSNPVFPDPKTTSPILNDPPGRTHLVTTIPTSFTSGSVVSQVTIQYEDPAYGQEASSASPPFRVTSSEPSSGPCLFYMSPDSGYRGRSVTAKGVRFGAAEGAITFFNGQLGLVSGWSDASIGTSAPAGAASGTHDVFVTDAAGNNSNPVPYTVEDYPPGQLTVVSPSPTCDAACLNILLHAGFRPTSIAVNEATLTDTTMLLKRCSDESCADFDLDVSVKDISYVEDSHTVEFAPKIGLEINRWYAAMLVGGDGGIKGTGGETISNTNATYAGVPVFRWTFKTKADPSACAVDHVLSTPESALITVQDATKTFHGAAYSSPDSCDASGQQIDTGGAPWAWTITPGDDADLTLDAAPTDKNAIVRGHDETVVDVPPDPETIRGTWGGKSGTSLLTTDFLWCDETTDCSRGGICPGSTCNVAAHRCSPVITDFTEKQGAVGDWVTINGCYFGSYVSGRSQVIYTDNKVGLWPDSSICPNPSELWRNDVILSSEVPDNTTPGVPGDDAIDGPISIVRGIDSATESTNDPTINEPILPDFDIVAGPAGPGICSVRPGHGPPGQQVNIAGQNFGDRNPGTDKVTFGLLDAINYNGWANALIDVLVPLGVPIDTIDTVVHKGVDGSNAWPFIVEGAACSVCVADADCGPGLGCGSDKCCAPTPAVTSTVPAAGADNVCRNSLIEANFSLPMDTGTMSSSTVQLTVNGGLGDGSGCTQADQCASGVCSASTCVGSTVSVSISKKASQQVRVSPGLLLKATAYRMLLTGLKSAAGVRLPDYQWVFTTADSDEPCVLDRVKVSDEDGNALWEPTATGQTQAYLAQPLHGSDPISEIPGVYDWSWAWTSSDTTVASLSGAAEPDDGTATVNAKTEATAGQSTVKATATIQKSGAPAGTKSGTALIDFSKCGLAWVFDDSAGNCNPAGEGCPNEHFHLDYCRDGSAGLPDFNLKVIKGKTDDVLKQYLFKENKPESLDAIGLRVYANPEHLSPAEWYKRQFPFESSSPSTITVDGYSAVRNGRTVYVAGTSLDDAASLLTPTIYILSYNDDATSATKAIFDQMLERLRLNTNASIGPENKSKIIRDTRRLSDLQDVTIGLEAYKLEHGSYPALDAGTYLLTMSTSRWPSWQSTLGNALRKTLPEDPVNIVQCPDDFDQGTCWKEPTKTFQCQPGSHIYAYHATGAAADAYKLYGMLEYDGPGTWISSSPIGNVCSFDAPGGSTCACFNYERP